MYSIFLHVDFYIKNKCNHGRESLFLRCGYWYPFIMLSSEKPICVTEIKKREHKTKEETMLNYFVMHLKSRYFCRFI